MPQPPAKREANNTSNIHRDDACGSTLSGKEPGSSEVIQVLPDVCSQRSDGGVLSGSFRLASAIIKLIMQEITDQTSDEQIDEVVKSQFAQELRRLADKLQKTRGGNALDTSTLFGVPASITKAQTVISAGSNVNERVHRPPSPSLRNNMQTISLADLYFWQQDLIRVFHELDVDGDGKITVDELRNGLKAAGIPQARVTKMFRILDKDSSGALELHEWVDAIATTAGPSKELQVIQSTLKKKQARDGKIFDEKARSAYCRFLMLNPSSKTRIFWDILITALLFYIAVVAPFILAFDALVQGRILSALNLLDKVIDYLLIADCALNFRTGFYNADGDLVMDWRLAARYYLHTWFLLDFVSCLPFEFASVTDHVDTSMVKLVKFFKLARVLKLLTPRHEVGEEVAQFIEDMLQSKTLHHIIRRGPVVLKMLVLCHWLACGMKMASSEYLATYQDVAGSLLSEYLAAVYWAMTTMTTVGYGDITPKNDLERAYVTMAMVIGGAFYGYIIGSIASIVHHSDLNTAAYYARMDLIQAWIAHHRLPNRVKRNVRRFFKAYLSEKSAVNEADIWQDLSPELQKEIGQYLMHDDVRFNQLFDGLTLGSIVRLQSILKRVTIPAGRIVTSAGEVGVAMYILVSGVVELDIEAEQVTSILGPGQSFGEEVLLGLKDVYAYKSTVMNKAKFEMLLQDEFLDLFQNMPNVMERMRQNAHELHQENHDVSLVNTRASHIGGALATTRVFSESKQVLTKNTYTLS